MRYNLVSQSLFLKLLLDNVFKTTKKVTYTLNKMIDVNYYPLSETELSAKRHRAIGIGVQGLADAFLLMRFHNLYCNFDCIDLCCT